MIQSPAGYVEMDAAGHAAWEGLSLTMGYGARSNQRNPGLGVLGNPEQSLSSVFTKAQRTRNRAKTSGYSYGATTMEVQGQEEPGGAQPEDIPPKKIRSRGRGF